MKKNLLLLFLAFVSYSNAQISSAGGSNNKEMALNHLVVKFKNTAQPFANILNKQSAGTVLFGIPAMDILNEKYQCKEAENLFSLLEKPLPQSLSNVYLLVFERDVDIVFVAKEYEATGLFERVAPDYIGYQHGTVHQELLTPNDQYFASRQWSLNNNGSFNQANVTAKSGADAKMIQAWDITTGDTATIVGIIDSGNKLDHPEFSGRIWVNSSEIPGNGQDDDGNGFIDDNRGWDFVNNDNVPTDDNGHGTNVSGIIGATGNNSTLYAGMNWKCKLMIVKAFAANGSYLATNIVKALEYAVNNGAKVINFSGGANGADPNLKAMIDYAYDNGVLFVASNGNNNTSTPQYPAAWADKTSSVTHQMSVGATNVNDTRCNPFNGGGGSNYGNWTSVVAPGNFIYSVSYNSNTGSSSINGTSQAAPHVAGLASLLLAVNKNLTVTEMIDIIETTADDKVGNASEDVTGWDQYMGWGRINGYKAVQKAKTMSTAINETPSVHTNAVVIPNPFSKSARMIFNENKAISSVVIYDIYGNEARRYFPERGSELVLSGEELANGIYLYQAHTLDGKIISGKFAITAY